MWRHDRKVCAALEIRFVFIKSPPTVAVVGDICSGCSPSASASLGCYQLQATKLKSLKLLSFVLLLLLLWWWWFAEVSTTELYHATLGCLQLGTYQQLNLSCTNNSLIYVVDVRHGHSNNSQVTCAPDMTSSPSDDGSWCLDGPPYNEMVIIQCNSRRNCIVDTAEMSIAMYTCHGHVTNVIQATYRCLPGTNTNTDCVSWSE